MTRTVLSNRRGFQEINICVLTGKFLNRSLLDKPAVPASSCSACETSKIDQRSTACRLPRRRARDVEDLRNLVTKLDAQLVESERQAEVAKNENAKLAEEMITKFVQKSLLATFISGKFCTSG